MWHPNATVILTFHLTGIPTTNYELEIEIGKKTLVYNINYRNSGTQMAPWSYRNPPMLQHT